MHFTGNTGPHYVPIVPTLVRCDKMSKAKKPLSSKSYWEKLVKEIQDKDITKKDHYRLSSFEDIRSKKSHSVDYQRQPTRRAIKYQIGEPSKETYLTQREADCMILLLQGKTLSQTGLALQLSPRTVEYYLNKIKRKLNCRKKKEVIHIVSKTQFIKMFQDDPYNQ